MTSTVKLSLLGRLAGRTLLGLLLLFILVALPACQPSIVLLPPGDVPYLGVATVVPALHSVSLIGVDFDPPLDYNQIISNGGVTLLVAIENLGLSTEPTVHITARLLDPADSAGQVELLNETVTTKSLAPGEVRVVRFTQVSELPLRERYSLAIEVSTASGELGLEDSTRIFDIVVRDAR